MIHPATCVIIVGGSSCSVLAVACPLGENTVGKILQTHFVLLLLLLHQTSIEIRTNGARAGQSEREDTANFFHPTQLDQNNSTKASPTTSSLLFTRGGGFSRHATTAALRFNATEVLDTVFLLVVASSKLGKIDVCCKYSRGLG